MKDDFSVINVYLQEQFRRQCHYQLKENIHVYNVVQYIFIHYTVYNIKHIVYNVTHCTCYRYITGV